MSIKPRIIYEDPDFIVIDKPWGITVNKSETEKEETIQDWAEKKLKIKGAPVAHTFLKTRQAHVENDAHSGLSKKQSLPYSLNESLSKSIDQKGKREQTAFSSLTNGQSSENLEEEFRSRGGVVHRLDKETSGILLIAKNPQSFSKLKNQFKERKVEKVYVALAHGEVKPEKGEINAPVGRLPHNRTRFGVIAGGREAATSYKVLSIMYYAVPAGRQVSDGKKEPLSLLELYPKTGRTHQIRVHLKYINHPIFSDPLYAGRKTAREDRKALPRLFLHAYKLSFNHPATGGRLALKAPLPSELENFLSKLDLVGQS